MQNFLLEVDIARVDFSFTPLRGSLMLCSSLFAVCRIGTNAESSGTASATFQTWSPRRLEVFCLLFEHDLDPSACRFQVVASVTAYRLAV